MVASVTGFFLLMNKHLFSWRSKSATVHLASDMRDETPTRISLRSVFNG
jgi:hypothetical protein